MLVRFWGTRGSLPVAPTAGAIRHKIASALVAASGRNFNDEGEAEDFVVNELSFAAGGTYGGATPCVERGAHVQQPLDARPRRRQLDDVRRAVTIHAPRELERPREHGVRRAVHDAGHLTRQLRARSARQPEPRLRDVARHRRHARRRHVHVRELSQPPMRIAHQHARLERAIPLEHAPQHRTAQQPGAPRNEDDAPRPVTRDL